MMAIYKRFSGIEEKQRVHTVEVSRSRWRQELLRSDITAWRIGYL